MQPKTRMTFRFDPPPKPQKQDKPPAVPPEKAEDKRETPLPEASRQAGHTGHAGYSGGPLQDDPYTLEELIRSYETMVPISPATGQDRKHSRSADGKDPAPEKDKADAQAETYGWTLHDWPLQEDASPGRKAHVSSRESGPTWWRAWTSVAGAIVTGALFGYLVLTLFTGEPLFPSWSGGGPAAGIATQAPPAEAPAAGPAAEETGSGPAGLPGAAAVQSLPAEEYYFLQYGVFQTEEGLEAAMAALASRGVAAASDRLDGFRAYAGAAPTREVAELLAGQLPNLEVYVKPVKVAPVQAPMPEASGAFAAESHRLARQLLRMSALALQDDLPQPFEEAELAALKESHRQWLQTVEAASLLPGAGQAAGAAMIRAMNEAMAHVEDYGSKRSRFHLWGIQSNMMKLILADQTWRAGLNEARP